MMNRSLVFLLALFLSLQAFATWGQEEAPDSDLSYFFDKERGWFWYEVIPEPVSPRKPKEKPRPIPNPPPSPIEARTQETKPESEPAEPEPLSAAWLRKNLKGYLNKALDDPSPENVAAFYYLQRVMMDKAERFTNAARFVVMSDPHLDETVRRPVATYAANEANRQASLTADQALKDIAGHVGILFFFRSDCPYCHVEAPILAMLERAYGFTIYPVALDGKPMPNGLYPNFKTDRGQAAMLGVESTPALFLMKPPKEIVPLSQGAMSLEELTGRILLAAKESGWIDEARYQTIQGIRPAPKLVALPGAISAETAKDPFQLINALQQGDEGGSMP